MTDRAPFTPRGAPLLLFLLAALCLVLPAGAEDGPPGKSEAAKVATKMDKALTTAHQAEDEREALRRFEDAVAEYARLHADQLARLGVPESVATQKALAEALAVRRAKAAPGDIFQPEVQPLFRRLIAEQLQGPDALDARQSIVQGNPGHEKVSIPVVVRVNAEYPVGAARSTVPPSVLATLPPLPSSLHYRFVGRDLILVDSVAQLIVDFLPAAAPAPAAR
jgi:hypothetical protein